MKIRYLILLFLFGCVSFCCRAKPSTETALDRSTAELAASLLLEKLQADILSGKPDSELLFHEMSQHSGDYIAPDPAREKLEAIFSRALSKRYYDAAGKYLDRLAGENGRDIFFSEAFLQAALQLPEQSVAETVRKTYPGAFSEARSFACREQAKTLVAGIQPSETEFENMPRAALNAMLTSRIAAAQKQPVFQENLTYISETLVKPMIEEAEQQRKAQRNFIDTQLVDGWAPDTIAGALTSELVKYVQTSVQHAEDQRRIAYGMFPSVVAAIPEAAKKRAAKKIARVVEEMSVGVDSDVILDTIKRNLETHRTAAASMQAFSPHFEETLAESVLAECEKLVPVEEWPLFEMFSRTSLKGGSARTALVNRVRRELLPKVKAVREAYAQRQVTDGFPDLITQRWFPSGALVDDVMAQVDYPKAVKAWREMSELARYAQKTDVHPLLEESEQMLDVAVVGLFERGRMAQTRQHGIVNDVFNEIKDAIGQGRAFPELAVAVDRYTQKVKNVWALERDNVLWGSLDATRPENAAEQHVSLFPSTEERILLKVKSLMESLEHDRQEREATPEAPPTENPPEESESDAATAEKPELIELDSRFELDQRGSDIQLVFYIGNERRAVLACSHSPNRYRREFSQTVEQAVSALIHEMAGYTSAGSRVTLVVNIVVKNDLVYYGIVARLSDALNGKTDFLSETGVELNLVPPIMEK